MSHDAVEANTQSEVEKGSLLQALATQEIQESQSLSDATLKAEQIIEDAQKDAQSQLAHLPTQLDQLETNIIKKESDQGTKEALEIQVIAEKALADNINVWQTRVDQAAQNLVSRVLKVGS